jgi:rod shape determining protein RodA
MMLFDRRYLACFDWISFILILILSFIGLSFIYSATATETIPYSMYFKKQLAGILSGIVLYGIFCVIDYRTTMRWAYFGYFVLLMLLAFTMIKGHIGMGAKRWINLYIIKFQPSELAKMLFPGYVSYYLATEKRHEWRASTFLPFIIMLIISCFLVLKQPDLGTALIILFSGCILLWVSGIPRSFVYAGIICACIGGPILWTSLKPYQKTRVIVFLGGGEHHKERYQLEQAQIAIGSGGLFGKGFYQGTQNRLRFLPESRTDFIFAVLCEEWGFAGAASIIMLYLILFWRLFAVIFTIKHRVAQILALGLVLHIMLSTIINMSMVLGLLPIVGIPLPFMSYGITHLWISFASLGWFNSIASRRFLPSLS